MSPKSEPLEKQTILLEDGKLYRLRGFLKPLIFFGWYVLPRAGFKEEDAIFFSEAGISYFSRAQLRTLAPTLSAEGNSYLESLHAQSQP